MPIKLIVQFSTAVAKSRLLFITTSRRSFLAARDSNLGSLDLAQKSDYSTLARASHVDNTDDDNNSNNGVKQLNFFFHISNNF